MSETGMLAQCDLDAIRKRYDACSAHLDRWDGADFKLEPDDVYVIDDIPDLLANLAEARRVIREAFNAGDDAFHVVSRAMDWAGR